MRIGELSRELETIERSRTDLRDTADAQSKTETLAKAGVNIRTAERYEELAGGKEKQAQEVAVAAAVRQKKVFHGEPFAGILTRLSAH